MKNINQLNLLQGLHNFTSSFQCHCCTCLFGKVYLRISIELFFVLFISHSHKAHTVTMMLVKAVTLLGFAAVYRAQISCYSGFRKKRVETLLFNNRYFET